MIFTIKNVIWTEPWKSSGFKLSSLYLSLIADILFHGSKVARKNNVSFLINSSATKGCSISEPKGSTRNSHFLEMFLVTYCIKRQSHDVLLVAKELTHHSYPIQNAVCIKSHSWVKVMFVEAKQLCGLSLITHKKKKKKK